MEVVNFSIAIPSSGRVSINNNIENDCIYIEGQYKYLSVAIKQFNIDYCQNSNV